MVEYSNWALGLGLIGLFFAWALFAYVRQQPAGTETMRELADLISSGAMTS